MRRRVDFGVLFPFRGSGRAPAGRHSKGPPLHPICMIGGWAETHVTFLAVE